MSLCRRFKSILLKIGWIKFPQVAPSCHGNILPGSESKRTYKFIKYTANIFSWSSYLSHFWSCVWKRVMISPLCHWFRWCNRCRWPPRNTPPPALSSPLWRRSASSAQFHTFYSSQCLEFILSGSGSSIWGWIPIRIQGFDYQKVIWNEAKITRSEARMTWSESKVTWTEEKMTWTDAKITGNWTEAKITWSEAKVIWTEAKMTWSKAKVTWRGENNLNGEENDLTRRK